MTEVPKGWRFAASACSAFCHSPFFIWLS
jgi:hypothetical protein